MPWSSSLLVIKLFNRSRTINDDMKMKDGDKKKGLAPLRASRAIRTERLYATDNPEDESIPNNRLPKLTIASEPLPVKKSWLDADETKVDSEEEDGGVGGGLLYSSKRNSFGIQKMQPKLTSSTSLSPIIKKSSWLDIEERTKNEELYSKRNDFVVPLSLKHQAEYSHFNNFIAREPSDEPPPIEAESDNEEGV